MITFFILLLGTCGKSTFFALHKTKLLFKLLIFNKSFRFVYKITTLPFWYKYLSHWTFEQHDLSPLCHANVTVSLSESFVQFRQKQISYLPSYSSTKTTKRVHQTSLLATKGYYCGLLGLIFTTSESESTHLVYYCYSSVCRSLIPPLLLCRK